MCAHTHELAIVSTSPTPRPLHHFSGGSRLGDTRRPSTLKCLSSLHTDMLGCKYFLPRFHMDMETSLGSWIPAENYFPDQNLKIKKATQGLFTGLSSKQPPCGCWGWLFCSARPQRGAQGIPLAQPGPARRVRESWMGAWWPYFPTSPPQHHRQCTVLPRGGVCAHAQGWQGFLGWGAHPTSFLL